jgi:3-hydroxyisobutyrate dehydrogenase-like beta-hydroxyacid dehydrogenase
MREGAARSWLIVGHGSVGSALAKRIGLLGEPILVYDPAPRMPVTVGQRVETLTGDGLAITCVVSCVPPAVAESVPELIAPVVDGDSVLFDWNTTSPEAKRGISAAATCDVVDVALLDTLDSDAGRPRVAISGPNATLHLPLLEKIGFHVDVAGAAPGDAALLKFARSMFMKSLEGLVLEYEAISHGIDGQGLVAASIANNLGDQFVDFMRLLVATNRLHAARRARELAEAVEAFEERGSSTTVARAVVPLLERCAELWDRPDAPPGDAALDDLIEYLSREL